MRQPRLRSVSVSGAESSARRRLFYALLFSDEDTERIAERLEELQRLDIDRSVRWTLRSNLHLTLRFLGELAPEQVGLAVGLPGKLQLPGPIDLRTAEADAFPSARRPRVLAIGISGADQSSGQRLLELQGLLEEGATGFGLPAEERRFALHITLGRVRRGRRPSAGLMEGLDEWDPGVGSIVCRAVSLMESHLEERGTRYEEVESWELPPDRTDHGL